MSSEWERGYRDGWRDATDRPLPRAVAPEMIGPAEYQTRKPASIPGAIKKSYERQFHSKRKRRQSGKQKLLTDMAGKKWKAYKRNTPKGKKTYIDIRAQVSRSQAYKKKARRL